MSARKIFFLVLLLGFGAVVETAWHVRGDWRIGPEGCRVIGGRFYGPSYAFEQTAERALPAGETKRLEVKNAFGAVRVTAGGPGVVKVKLRKVVFLPTEDKAKAFADRIELRVSGDGAVVKVGTNRDDIARREDVGLETHLEVEAPPDTSVEVRNEHGRVDLAGLADADVVTSFDGVAIEKITGALQLEARHGDVRVSGIGAGLTLSSRHGNVEVEDVAGAAKLDVEHGDLVVRRTGAADVSLQFGGLQAEGVRGDLVVRGAHAELRASDVAGRAEVETSFAGIHLARVGGDVRATAKNGEITAEDVAGGLFAETTHAGVSLERVDGPVESIVDHGSFEARGLAKGVKVRTTGGEVSLDGFAGPVEVEVERGTARLSPRASLAAPVTASATHGEVHLDVPEGSAFDLDAESRRGELRSEVAGLAPPETDRQTGRGQRFAGKLGGGGALVRLRADGDVVLEAKSAGPIADRAVARPSATAPPAEAPAPVASPSTAATPKPRPAPQAAPEAPAPPRKPEAPEEPSVP
jgi:Putative adhesin